MHPVWAGSGGNWPVRDETFDPGVVLQQDQLSCGAACGEMLLRDCGINVTQAAIVATIGVPITSRRLAEVLNIFNPSTSPRWAGGPLAIKGATQEEVFDTLNTTGSWAAMLWETGSKIGHMIVVDGIDREGYVLIRDPWEGTRYTMKKSDFLQYWNDYGVYRREQ